MDRADQFNVTLKLPATFVEALLHAMQFDIRSTHVYRDSFDEPLLDVFFVDGSSVTLHIN